MKYNLNLVVYKLKSKAPKTRSAFGIFTVLHEKLRRWVGRVVDLKLSNVSVARFSFVTVRNKV